MKTKVSFCCSLRADLMTLYADRLVPAADTMNIVAPEKKVIAAFSFRLKQSETMM